MIEPQGKRIHNVPKVEPRGLLPCSTDVTRGSAFGFNQEPPVEMLIDQLAALIVEVYFYDKNNPEQ
jgi:hypothetical protein